MAQYFLDLLYTLTNCLSCFPGSPKLKINNRSFKILRLLGEGGFSYVYLVQDLSAETLYALKKIRCPFGQESVQLALKEVEAYTLFAPHPNIIQSIDHSISSSSSDPGAKTVYILLPYYRRGNLQDAINANLVNGTKFPEKRLMKLFLGVAKAVQRMHGFKVGDGRPGEAESVRNQAEGADRELERSQRGKKAHSEENEEQEVPLMESEVTRAQEGVEEGQLRAYAHRDIKPGNIMIDDDGVTPILMDLGSIAASPTPITSRSLAIALQDTAAEHSTMPYRAPELFDVKTGSIIDTKVDIWSLGCTLYACLVGKSPFEMRSDETGGSLSLCVLGGDWRFPDEEGGGGGIKRRDTGKAKQGQPVRDAAAGKMDAGISEGIREIVRKCLSVEPAERPDIGELIGMIERVIQELPDDVE